MSNINQCHVCGSPLPAQTPEGLCPACLLRAGLADSSLDGDTSAQTVDLSGARHMPETLAETFASVARIMLRETAADAGPPVKRSADPIDGDASSRYRIDGEIARGGMGVVLKGHDPDLGRDVALKVLRDDSSDRPELIRRFIEEAQIGGQLQHPGIVPVYELGVFADHRPFFSMKLVRGRTLADLLTARTSPADESSRFLGIFEQIAQTVAYAHARGVIHRDLKPSNVMVGGFGEVQVMDWGLAKVLSRDEPTGDEAAIATARSIDSATELSRAGSVLGTPSYMAPEQARGEIEKIDERADVFALGSILCEILTGAPAFVGDSSIEIQRKASRSETAEALARLDAAPAEPELVALARDCLTAERDDRPRDAGVVRERITAHLTGVRERLRVAEIDRARAEAQAIGERRRRRLQLWLAASLLALTTLGGLTFTYELTRRQARAARVDRLLSEARLLRDQALAKPEDVAGWERAEEVANRLAEDLGSSAQASLASLRGEIQSGLKSAKTDQELLARLVEIRSAAADDPDGSITDAAYADAFNRAGINPDQDDPARVGALVAGRPAAVAVDLVAALDAWASNRRNRNAEGFKKVLAAARAADPDPDRDALRAALLVEDKAERLERLRPLAERATAESWSSTTLNLLGGALADVGDLDAGVEVLRRASWSHPGDPRTHYLLGLTLERRQQPQFDEVIRAYSTAWSLQPELAAHNLAHALERVGRGEEAGAVWGDLIGRRPDNGRHLACYGTFLKERGRVAEAASAYSRAIAASREEIRLRPLLADAHAHLGLALYGSGDALGAIAAFREAIRLKPDFIDAHYNLGSALHASGDLPGAIASYRQAIRLRPDHAKAHYNLGRALRVSGDAAGAIASYRQAIRLRPDFAEAHCNLGLALTQQARYDEALAELRRGHELGSKRAGWPYPSAKWVAQAERLAALADRLPTILAGEEKPADNDERLALLQIAYNVKRYVAAARLGAEAMEADPKLVVDPRSGLRYNAACSAALAAAGKGEDDPKPDDAARIKLRYNALNWLKAERDAFAAQINSDDPKARADAVEMLRHWKEDPDLAGVRDAEALEALPEPERADWRALWDDVDRLLSKAGESR